MTSERKFRPVILAVVAAGSVWAAGPDVQRARDLYQKTQYQATINALLSSDTASAEHFELLGQAYYMNGQYKLAIDSLEKATRADSSNAVYFDWLGKACGRRAETSNFITALTYAGKTRDSFEKAVELDGNNLEALSDLFEYYLEAPRSLGGGMDKAQAIAARIGRLNVAEYESKLAEIAEKQKQFPEAEQHLRRAAELEASHIGRSIDLAEFLAKRGRYAESEQLLRSVEAAHPGAPRVMYARASVDIRSGHNFEEARLLLSNYLSSEITPDDPPREDAVRLARRAIKGGGEK